MTWDTLLLILKGLGFGASGAGLFALLSKLVARNTTLTTARMDDRAKHIETLLAEARSDGAQIEKLEEAIRELQAREMRVTKFATYFGAHVEMLTGMADNLAESTKRAHGVATASKCGVVLTTSLSMIADIASMLKLKLDAASKRFEQDLEGFIDSPFKGVAHVDSVEPTKPPSTPAAQTLKVEIGPEKKKEE